MKFEAQKRTSEIYTDILGRIVQGELPPGQRMIEEDLAREYRVSRTPIREVIFALERDGLVARAANRGAKVIAFTPDDVEQVYEIRKVLECLGLRNVIGFLQLNALMELEQRHDFLNRKQGPHWSDEFAELDVEFHRLIVSNPRNRRLVGYLDNIALLINSLRLLGARNPRHARRASEQHLEILHALLQRDEPLAERLLAEHIETSKRNALELFLEKSASVIASAVDGESSRPGMSKTP
jgi:DNA-binding GntR family transcriptional regulator